MRTALALVQQTRTGRRQLALAGILRTAPAPLPREELIRRVEAEVGAGCYGRRPAPTLWSDVQALKRAGLPIRYSRAAGRTGYYLPSPEEELQRWATRMLEQIGWNAASLKQIEVYAHMAPAAKIEQMFRLRRAQMNAMIARIRKEQPDLSREELAAIVQERLRWARDEEEYR
jgi:hypothetical protein